MLKGGKKSEYSIQTMQVNRLWQYHFEW